MKQNEVVKHHTAVDVINALQTTTEIDLIEGLASLAAMPEENFTEITSGYWKPVEGQIYDMVVTGVSVQKFPSQANPAETLDVECVHFSMLEKGKLVNYIYGGQAFVSCIRQEIEKDKRDGRTLQAIGIRAFKTGETKSAKGKYSNFVVKRMYATLETNAGN